jgi:hypothetical protein
MSASISIASNLSRLAAAAVLASALAGLFAPRFYRLVNPILLPGSYGQDWMSLALLPALIWAIQAAARGSLRGAIVWLGLLTYYLYGYALYAFGPQLTSLYPIYVAIVGLSAFALVIVARSLDTAALHDRLRDRLPALGIIVLFGVIVVSLSPVWIAMLIAAVRDERTSPFTTVHVLDLAFVFPALIAAAAGLWRHRPWAGILAGPLLILTATMMGSLVLSEVIAATRFTPDPLALTTVFSILALAAAFLTHWYLRALAD